MPRKRRRPTPVQLEEMERLDVLFAEIQTEREIRQGQLLKQEERIWQEQRMMPISREVLNTIYIMRAMIPGIKGADANRIQTELQEGMNRFLREREIEL